MSLVSQKNSATLNKALTFWMLFESDLFLLSDNSLLITLK